MVEYLVEVMAMHGRHCGPQGFGPWFMFGGGHRSWGEPGRGHGSWGAPPWARGPKARRGDVRAAILAVLADQPLNGYQIIQEIADRSGGMWKPSPGSVYPTLQQLEDEGLVVAKEDGGRKVYRLTAEGEEYVETNSSEVGAPFEAMSSSAAGGDDLKLQPLIGQTAAALWQVLATGTPDQQARARQVLADTRRKLYGILADGDDATGEA
ncbi:PadR family transcriptional regulator [Hoyosella sp. YIM 151337]|uniref:PadR family transcriptional regulator n=1 Tax=Hoyosella sp. YIM 151337 TaxID=2992742 RepID=UPI002235DA1B|nr:PadR family transcriptional regulator [Hoyosella sp. YIM 151337]MCW4354543.1 PadR family transcriptional regulator [Hoyosella sp. YIM 151337]